MKTIFFKLFFFIIFFGCSSSDEDNVIAPNSLYPSEYVLKNSSGQTIMSVYFGDPEWTTNSSYLTGGSSCHYYIVYTYNKPNGTITTPGETTFGNHYCTGFPFLPNKTYNFRIDNKKLFLKSEGEEYQLTLDE